MIALIKKDVHLWLGFTVAGVAIITGLVMDAGFDDVPLPRAAGARRVRPRSSDLGRSPTGAAVRLRRRIGALRARLVASASSSGRRPEPVRVLGDLGDRRRSRRPLGSVARGAEAGLASTRDRSGPRAAARHPAADSCGHDDPSPMVLIGASSCASSCSSSPP